jgi:hypothetical protein
VPTRSQQKIVPAWKCNPHHLRPVPARLSDLITLAFRRRFCHRISPVIGQHFTFNTSAVRCVE